MAAKFSESALRIVDLMDNSLIEILCTFTKTQATTEGRLTRHDVARGVMHTLCGKGAPEELNSLWTTFMEAVANLPDEPTPKRKRLTKGASKPPAKQPAKKKKKKKPTVKATPVKNTTKEKKPHAKTTAKSRRKAFIKAKEMDYSNYNVAIDENGNEGKDYNENDEDSVDEEIASIGDESEEIVDSEGDDADEIVLSSVDDESTSCESD